MKQFLILVNLIILVTSTFGSDLTQNDNLDRVNRQATFQYSEQSSSSFPGSRQSSSIKKTVYNFGSQGQRTITEETKSQNSNPPQRKVTVLDTRFSDDEKTYVSSAGVPQPIRLQGNNNQVLQNQPITQRLNTQGSGNQQIQNYSTKSPISNQRINTQGSQQNSNIATVTQRPIIQSVKSQTTSATQRPSTQPTYRSQNRNYVSSTPIVTQRPVTQNARPQQYQSTPALSQRVNIQDNRIPQGQYSNNQQPNVGNRNQNLNGFVPVIPQPNPYLGIQPFINPQQAFNQNLQQQLSISNNIARIYGQSTPAFQQIVPLYADIAQNPNQNPAVLSSRFGEIQSLNNQHQYRQFSQLIPQIQALMDANQRNSAFYG